MKRSMCGTGRLIFRILTFVAVTCPVALALDPSRAVKDYHLSQWQFSDGLPYPSISVITQTRDGYLWLATRAGLGRFDGLTFTAFTQKNLPQLQDDRINGFCVVDDGTMWIGTGKGVLCYRDGIWSRPVLGPAIDDHLVASINLGPDGAMLFSVNRRGEQYDLFELRGGAVRPILLFNGDHAPRFKDLQVASVGTVLAGQGLFRLSEGKLHNIAAAAGVGDGAIHSLVTDHQGTLWVGTPRGLTRWDGKESHALFARDGLPANAVRSLWFDSDGNLWVGTSNGVARYREGRFEPLLLHGIETLSHTLCFFEDRERNLWIGTDNGLFCARDTKVATLSQRDGLPVNPTLCVLPARDGTIWIGTIGGGLSRLTPSGIRTLTVADGLADESIGGLAEDASGGLWIASYTRGVSRYKDGRFTHYPLDQPQRVRGLAIASDGQPWVLHSGKLMRFDGERFVAVRQAAADFDHFRALHITPSGDLWMSGAQALARLRDGQWTLFPTPDPMREKLVQQIFSTADGTIWATQDGPVLVRIQQERRENFAMPPELGPLVYSGLEHRGELWINFRAGVARIAVSEIEAMSAGKKSLPAYSLLNEVDGMRSNAPNNIGSPGAVVWADGTLCFPTSMGLALIHPDRIRISAHPPNVVIEHVFADKKEYAAAAPTVIPAGRGELTFQFTAPTFVNPTQARFRYRLHGLDSDWIDAGRKREAFYGGLPPGNYRFEVMGANSEGLWSPRPATRELVLLPHFYQRWWFFGAIGATVAGAGFGAYRWRSRQLYRRAQTLQLENEKLELRIAERTSELRESLEKLRSSEYFYHSLVESLPQVLVRKDAQGRYTYANPAFAEMLGRPIDDIIGRTDEDLFPREIAAKAKADDQRVLSSRRPLDCEEVLEKPGKGRRFLHVNKAPLVDPRGEALGVQVLYWDMTVFRETENKLKNAQKELVEFSRLAGIAEMATGVLHNMGNALNSVRVAASVANTKAEHMSLPRFRRIADMLEAEKHRLAEFLAADSRGAKLPSYLSLLVQQLEQERVDLIRELREVGNGIEHLAEIVAAQQASARVAVVVEKVPATELMEFACRMNEALISRHDITLVREYAATPDLVIERAKALQILCNLIRNAIEALEQSEHDKRIVLGVRLSETDKVEFSVADNGIGIAPENLQRLFEFGYTTKKTGHGFGLHNSALTAKAMGGEIRIESAGEGQGATFVLELPPNPPDHIQTRQVELQEQT